MHTEGVDWLKCSPQHLHLCKQRPKFKEAPETILTVQTVDPSFLKICSALDCSSPSLWGHAPFSERGAGLVHSDALRARAGGLRLPAPSIPELSVSHLGPPGGSSIPAEVAFRSTVTALRRTQTPPLLVSFWCLSTCRLPLPIIRGPCPLILIHSLPLILPLILECLSQRFLSQVQNLKNP